MNKIDYRPMMETALLTTISNVEGVKSMVSFSTVYDDAARILKVNFIAKCENDEVLEMSEELSVQRGVGRWNTD